MKTILAMVLVVPGLLALNQVQILVPNTTQHDHYLFNQDWQFDQRDYAGMPHFFYWVNANSSPRLSTRRSASYCTIVQNPGTNYNPTTVLDWWQFPPPPPAGKQMIGAEGMEPYAVTGEYYESARLSYPTATVTGFKFLGEFIGQHVTTQTTVGYYAQAAYFSDRECFDGGTEYGWYHEPVYYGCNVNESPCTHGYIGYDQPADQVYFYYSKFTNCGYLYVCSTDSYYDHAHWQPTNQYLINFNNHANHNNTYQWNFQVLRCPAAGCAGVAQSSNAFALSITDPSTGLGAQCSVSGPTKVYFPTPGICVNVTVAIDGSWYPPTSVTNIGYITFADQSSTVFPTSTNYYCCGPPPAGNVAPTKYPDGHKATYAGLDVESAYFLYQ